MPMGYTHTETVDGKAGPPYPSVGHRQIWTDLFTRVWMGAAHFPVYRPGGRGHQPGFGRAVWRGGRLLRGQGGSGHDAPVGDRRGIPYMMVAILLLTVMSPGIGAIVLAYAATGWMSMARLVRGQVLRLKESEYVLGPPGPWAPGGNGYCFAISCPTAFR